MLLPGTVILFGESIALGCEAVSGVHCISMRVCPAQAIPVYPVLVVIVSVRDVVVTVDSVGSTNGGVTWYFRELHIFAKTSGPNWF